MKAIVKSKGNLALKEVGIPKIDDTDNILIKIELAAICRTDLNVAYNRIPSAETVILGHEFYGRIVELNYNTEGLSVGDKVTIDPTRFGKNKNLMCGVDVDGAFCEFIKVPSDIVYKLPEELAPSYSAYIEPIAASLAVLKAKFSKSGKGCIYGKNRISELTLKILKLYGYENCYIAAPEENLVENDFDYIIETVTTTKDMEKIIRAVKPNGIIVLKSRAYNPVEIVVNTLVRKDITMQAVSYGDFREAIRILHSQQLIIDDLIGETYCLEDYEKAFLNAQNCNTKKLYLKP